MAAQRARRVYTHSFAASALEAGGAPFASDGMPGLCSWMSSSAKENADGDAWTGPEPGGDMNPLTGSGGGGFGSCCIAYGLSEHIPAGRSSSEYNEVGLLDVRRLAW